MAKKIRFPLEMPDGTQVRTLQDLKEHFDLVSALEYYKSGKLLTWLQDRYLETEVEAIQSLDESAPDFPEQFCKIFGVAYTGSSVDLEEIARRQEKLAKLRTFTDEPEYIGHVDQVAFDQEDLADLLDNGQKEIYLCGSQFNIPVSQHGVYYKGITNPMIHLTGKLPEDMEETGITFENCTVENMPESFPNRIDAFLQWAYEKWACSNMNPLTITFQFQAQEKPVSMKLETISGSPEELMEQLTEKSQWCVQSSIASDALIDSFQLTVANADPSPKTSNLKHSFTAAISTETACAEVSDVETGRGRNGYRSLDIVLKKPVILSGTQYNRIRLISLTAFQKLSLHHDAIVNVRLVGNAIPVLTVKENGTGLGIARPSRCPYCASLLEVRNHKLFCSNLFCSENISDRFSNFFKKIGLPQYAGLTADILEQDLGCHNLADLVYLTKEKIESKNIYTQDLVHLPQQLREAIKTKRDYEILAAMGIPGLGNVHARQIIETCAFTVLGEQTMSTYSILVSTALGIKDQTVLNIISSSAFANEVSALAKLEYIKTETLDPVARYLRDSHANENTSTNPTATNFFSLHRRHRDSKI